MVIKVPLLITNNFCHFLEVISLGQSTLSLMDWMPVAEWLNFCQEWNFLHKSYTTKIVPALCEVLSHYCSTHGACKYWKLLLPNFNIM